MRKKDGLGGGDIKLAAWIGAVLGWKAMPFVILSASLLGIAAALAYIFIKRKSFDEHIPFGPFLAIGSLLAMVFLKSGAGLGWLSFLSPFQTI